MRFIDLFAGLGGFHLALSRLGHECVFASEIDPTLRELYHKNFSLPAHGDIRQVPLSEIPPHDILCAGFPCQPFSKAGAQKGFECLRYGTLIDDVVAILRERRPEFIILENVPNLTRHAAGQTWRAMKSKLAGAGYEIDEKRLSPHQFGIPQVRERVYIVGQRSGLSGYTWPEPTGAVSTSILPALDPAPAGAKPISKQVAACLECWQQFIAQYPEEHLPTHPIWSMEFGATYPYEERTPHAVGTRGLCPYRGSHGTPLRSLSPADRFGGLPSYARAEEATFPKWKINFIRQNREIYKKHKRWIDAWLPAIRKFPPSLQKLEWNCKGGEKKIWEYVIQFRASGVRVKRPSSSPSLVAMTDTQVPIVAWEKRYMTPWECARLQSLHGLTHLPAIASRAFKALGNAVNSDVVEIIARALITRTS